MSSLRSPVIVRRRFGESHASQLWRTFPRGARKSLGPLSVSRRHRPSTMIVTYRMHFYESTAYQIRLQQNHDRTSSRNSLGRAVSTQDTQGRVASNRSRCDAAKRHGYRPTTSFAAVRASRKRKGTWQLRACVPSLVP